MSKILTPHVAQLGKDRADRIKRLRDATRLSRTKFAEKYAKYGVKKTSLQNWEDNRNFGLTEGGAFILLQAFQEEGLKLSIEFLMYGAGTDPIYDSIPCKTIEKDRQVSEQEHIAEELRLFHQYHVNAVDTIITDDSLLPLLRPGDYVAGIRYLNHEMEKAIGHPSIIQTESGEQFVRVVTCGKDLGYYTLTCTNTKTAAATLRDVKLLSAAPILWIRKFEVKK